MTDELFIKSILGIYECKRQRGLSVEEATKETVQTVQKMQAEIEKKQEGE